MGASDNRQGDCRLPFAGYLEISSSSSAQNIIARKRPTVSLLVGGKNAGPLHLLRNYFRPGDGCWESGDRDCTHFWARLRHCHPGADSRQQFKDRVASLRDLRDPETGELLDRAMVIRFFAPRSFTAEEMAELQITGGMQC